MTLEGALKEQAHTPKFRLITQRIPQTDTATERTRLRVCDLGGFAPGAPCTNLLRSSTSAGASLDTRLTERMKKHRLVGSSIRLLTTIDRTEQHKVLRCLLGVCASGLLKEIDIAHSPYAAVRSARRSHLISRRASDAYRKKHHAALRSR